MAKKKKTDNGPKKNKDKKLKNIETQSQCKPQKIENTFYEKQLA